MLRVAVSRLEVSVAVLPSLPTPSTVPPLPSPNDLTVQLALHQHLSNFSFPVPTDILILLAVHILELVHLLVLIKLFSKWVNSNNYYFISPEVPNNWKLD